NQIRRQGRQAIVLTVCPTVFDGDVLTYDIAAFGQRLAEAGQHWPALRERRAAEKPDHRHRWLLCARRERPRGCAAEECNEVAPAYSPVLHNTDVHRDHGDHCIYIMSWDGIRHAKYGQGNGKSQPHHQRRAQPASALRSMLQSHSWPLQQRQACSLYVVSIASPAAPCQCVRY